MPKTLSEQPKKVLSALDVLELGVLSTAAPALLSFLAALLLPLQQIALTVPERLRPYVTDSKSFGTLTFAVLVSIFWPLAKVRAHRKLHGYHPRGTYQPGKINIWVAELEGDSEKHEARTRMIDSLLDLLGSSVAILRADISPHLRETGDGGQEAEEGNELAQEYLERNRGDLLLWGQYFSDPVPLMELRLVSVAEDGRQATPFEYDTTTYRPMDRKFRPYFTAALAALVATMAEDAEEQEGRYVVEVLRPLAQRIEHLANNLPRTMGYEERARVFDGLGNLNRILGYQEDSVPRLHGALRTLLRARACWRRQDGRALDSARTLVQIGRVCMYLGEKHKIAKYLEMSVSALDAALSTLKPETDFLQWANAKIFKGASLGYLGLSLNSSSHLEKASLEGGAVLTRPEIELFPRTHSEALDTLAMVYGHLGRIESDVGRVELCIQAYRRLLKIRTKEDNPLDWARTQMNLATAFSDLWVYEQRKELLEQAWIACERALEVFSTRCKPAYLGTVRVVQGNMLFKQHLWKDAADLYLQALTTLSRDTDEDAYNLARENLEIARRNMGTEGLKIQIS